MGISRDGATQFFWLANHVQPIVRIDIGDRISLGADGCRCGCTLPTVEVEGRDDEALTLSNP